ncbi:MAG: molybdenum cofactor guanylyltransferase [Sphingomonadaceae bacterium]
MLSPPIVILAGGRGSRIGGGKPQRQLGSQTLLDHVLARAREYGDDVAIAGGGDAAPAVRVLDDLVAGQGPISGLQSALHYAASKGMRHVLIVPCDTPFLPHDLLTRLTGAIGDEAAALACSGDRIHPACGLWAVSAADRLHEYVALGRQSLIGFAELVGYSAVEWPGAPVDPFFNINSAADLEEAERLLDSLPARDQKSAAR